MFELNKNFNLLDEQLAESGLEMAFEPFSAISAVASIAGGIFGASEADKQNRAAEKAYEEQKEAAEEAADLQNKYNRKVFEADKQNYYNTRKYELETAQRQWKYNQSIQDFQYLQTVKQYGQSVENTTNQLTYNALAAQQAYEQEQAALNEIYIEDAFNRQGMLVDRVTNEGRAAMGQAGVSRNKALQSTLADVGRNAAIMSASLTSSVKQTNRNLRDIGMQRYNADMQARASMMLRPEKLPDLLTPTQVPERIWVEPMKVLPQAIGAPRQQSVFAPLISGLETAAPAIGAAFTPKPPRTPSNPLPEKG